MSFNVGENIGPYRIIEQLGQGGMATVYKAYHASLDRYVALKVLHPAFNQDQAFTARFQREARVVAKLDHPNIVPVYDYSEYDGRPYLVMKFIEGDTLKARLSQGPLSSQEIEQVVDSVGSALAYAHKQGILHRDIKPSNVLIATDGTMYLADFGLARIAEAGESTLSSDSIMGTPQYISPEQAMGKKDLDAGTDIYSFGVMLYELVVGQVPFSADTPFSIIHDHIYTPLPLPMDVNPSVPEPVQRVLLKALAKDRSDRYETVEDMVRAFKTGWDEAGVPMQGTAITMRPATSFKTAKATQTGVKTRLETAIPGKTVAVQSPEKKRSLWGWVAGATVLLLCCGVSFFAFRTGRLKNALAGNLLNPPPATSVSVASTNTSLPSPSQASTPPENQASSTSAANVSPEIQDAQNQVNANPGDPQAHLQLALAYWDAEQTRSAVEELAQAANLAGPTNRDFLQKAADEFRTRQAWIPAAGMYLRLVQSYSNGDVPVDVMNSFNESVYKAAKQKDMPLYVFFERIDAVSLPMGYVARGRYALYNGTVDDAKLQLAQAKKIKPDMYEAAMLEAEIALKTGNTQQAKSDLLALSADLGGPAWIRAMADSYLTTMQ